MFHRETDASKVALAGLVELLRRREFQFIDCQLTSEHVLSLGAVEVPRSRFLNELGRALDFPDPAFHWTEETVYQS